MSRIVKQAPPAAHYCHPGEEKRYYEPGYVDSVTGQEYGTDRWMFGDYYWHDLQLRAGTVWECDCGKTWVAEWIPDQVGRASVRCAHVEWREETRRERRKREKAAR